MPNRVPRRVRFTGALLVVGLCLLAGSTWWSTRRSRALKKLVDQQQQAPVGSRVEPIPAEWLPDLAWEMVRDPSHIEEVCAWIEDALPQAMVGSPRLNSVAVRRNRYAAGLMTGRRPEEVLPALEGVFPRASTFTASWTLSYFKEVTPPGHPRRTSLFLTASTHPDPAMRRSSLDLIDPSQGRPARTTEVLVRVEAMVDDQVSVVRERARTTAEELRALPGAK